MTHHKRSVEISLGYIIIGDSAITVTENWLDI